MHISVFELFSIGIGPSSSHTVGPMRAARHFIQILEENLTFIDTLTVELFGSLALTGMAHGTDKAILLGLEGEKPEEINPATVNDRLANIKQQKKIKLLNSMVLPFDHETQLIWHKNQVLPHHTNGMRFTAYHNGTIYTQKNYYSVGGGFIVQEEEYGKPAQQTQDVPYPFDTSEQLLAHCQKNNLTIAQVMLANEVVWRSEKEIHQRLLHIANIMNECIKQGCQNTGVLPGILKVPRRAPQLFNKLNTQAKPHNEHDVDIMNWLNLFAMAVNEENAAGGRVVTAPTNGAAGIIPSVLQYYKEFYPNSNEEGIINFLLTAGAIAILYKKGASISGAEVGCQGEVGVASSMAAGALAAVLGGSIMHVENAAEIAMEHHLGMTCDPVAGLVQIPCIERNAMGAVKAVNAARLALMENGEHKVSLDKVINTMRQTGRDMMTIYKETSQGGLAVNVPEC